MNVSFVTASALTVIIGMNTIPTIKAMIPNTRMLTSCFFHFFDIAVLLKL